MLFGIAASQKISFSVKYGNDEISGERGEIEQETTIPIDERLWNADPEALYTIMISKKVFASVPLGLLRQNGFKEEIVVYRNEDGTI